MEPHAAGMKEGDVIERIRGRFPGAGIGDDAAVISPPRGSDLLFASDMLVEGIHFERGSSTAGQAVQKAVTSSVSDIFAMGGAPSCVLISAGFPPGSGEGDLEQVVDGLEAVCGAYGIYPAGGDTVASPGGFLFDVAVLGFVESGCAVGRCGAGEGDALVLFGEVGASGAGISLLGHMLGTEEGKGSIEDFPMLDRSELISAGELAPRLSVDTGRDTIEAWCRERGLPGPYVNALMLVKHHIVPLSTQAPPGMLGGDHPMITAMIDISDGLARDLATLCRESGCGAAVDPGSIPVPSDLVAISGLDALALAAKVVGSGEEYSMLAAVRGLGPGEEMGAGRIIGRIVGAGMGIGFIGDGGRLEPFTESGFEHTF